MPSQTYLDGLEYIQASGDNKVYVAVHERFVEDLLHRDGGRIIRSSEGLTHIEVDGPGGKAVFVHKCDASCPSLPEMTTYYV